MTRVLPHMHPQGERLTDAELAAHIVDGHELAGWDDPIPLTRGEMTTIHENDHRDDPRPEFSDPTPPARELAPVVVQAYELAARILTGTNKPGPLMVAVRVPPTAEDVKVLAAAILSDHVEFTS